MNIISDANFASVIVVPYAKPCYVGPRYNGNRLYANKSYVSFETVQAMKCLCCIHDIPEDTSEDFA